MHTIIKTAISMAVLSSSFSSFAAAPVSDATGGDLATRVATLERMLEARNQVQFDIQQRLDELQQDVNSLNGNMERQNRQIEQIQTRQREIYQELDAKTKAAPVAVAPKADASTPVAPEGEKAAYEAAVKLVLQDKQYSQAITAFKSFIETYPDSSYAANAHYWLGQLLFNAGQREEAKKEFDIVANDYAKSNKRAEALLKSGMISEYFGKNEEAKQRYNEVISSYPGSSPAKLAQPRLSSLQ
ncbi:tol-pal system protein YbgF [Motilimonas pumila]|uniref:Cell division coordinator CpoB n=1 Tax=Motilimonas pumila TaxID=2303987 RepID=A0A418YG41_9GAMM|nr:tol-pal system protein YbgF [Motilimonas pumila]RJG48437.1 tol-pal system protein YbgF [Motilimonas pumila]